MPLDPKPVDPNAPVASADLAWVDTKGGIMPGWTTEKVDPATYKRNEFGFLLDYLYPVPTKADGTPVLTKADLPFQKPAKAEPAKDEQPTAPDAQLSQPPVQ